MPKDNPADRNRLQRLRQQNVALETTVASLRQEVEGLRRELTQLRRFRDAVWDKARTDLERWALREGLALDETHAPPPSGEVNTALETDGPPAPTVPQTPVERRAGPRHRVRCPVRFATSDGARTTTAMLIEISESGLLIRSQREVAVGARVACGFYVLRGPERELVLVKGRVVRRHTERAGEKVFALCIERITIEPARLVDCLVEPLQIIPHAERGERTLRMGVANAA